MSRWLKVAALVVAFVAVYGVSRALINSTPTTTTTTSTSTTTTTAPTSTSTTVATTSCDASDFSGVYNEGEGAAGTIYASITITKTTAGACTLDGWPLLTLQNKLGEVLPITLVDVPSSSTGFQFFAPQANEAPRAMMMGENSTATFSLAYSDVTTGTTACDDATTLSVQFVSDGATIDVTPTYAVEPCDNGQIWVSPYY